MDDKEEDTGYIVHEVMLPTDPWNKPYFTHLVCCRCGAEVYDQERHDRWHEENDMASLIVRQDTTHPGAPV
jgi:hypothetical protein